MAKQDLYILTHPESSGLTISHLSLVRLCHVLSDISLTHLSVFSEEQIRARAETIVARVVPPLPDQNRVAEMRKARADKAKAEAKANL